MRYFYQKTGEEKYLRAMEKNEEYIQAAFGVNNDWYNGLTDSNNLVAPLDGEQTRNYYTLNVFDLAGYYHDRYLDTGDEKFLKWAKDHFAFGWMGRMPVNMPDSTTRPRGLSRSKIYGYFMICPGPLIPPPGWLVWREP